MDEKLWYTVKDAAGYLGVSVDFIRGMMEDGLSYYRVRRICFIKKRDLDLYINDHKVVWGGGIDRGILSATTRHVPRGRDAKAK